MKQKTNISVRNNLGYHITSEMELGPNNGYSSGDILDANAVEQLIEDKINSLVGGATTSADTLKELEDKITQLAMSQITNDAGYVQQDANGQLKVNETNITNTINKIIVSNQPFPSTWPTDNLSSFSDLIAAIDGDEDAIKGKVYLSTVHYTNLPASMSDAELKVEIMDDSNPSHKIAVFSITSANVSPYNWHATMLGGELTEWRSYALVEEEPALTASLYYKVVSGMTLLCDMEGNLAYVQMGSYKYVLKLQSGKWVGDSTNSSALMQEPLTLFNSGPISFEYAEFSFTRAGSGFEWNVSPDVPPLQ